MQKRGVIFFIFAFGTYILWDFISSDNVADMILDIPATIVGIYASIRLWLDVVVHSAQVAEDQGKSK
jgi:hypothetical protein